MRVSPTIALVAAMCATGCGSSTEMYPVTTINPNPGAMPGKAEKPKPRTEFAKGMVPMIYFVNPPNSSGQSVRLKVYKDGGDEPVYDEAIDTDVGGGTVTTLGWQLRNFGVGDFEVKLVIDGSVAKTCTYKVTE